MVSPGDIQEAEQFGYPRVEDQLAEEKEDRAQCEGCLRYCEVSKCRNLCDVCQDNAASKEILESRHKQLCETVQDVALPLLEKMDPSYAVGEIIGVLRTSLNYCRLGLRKENNNESGQ